jgi:hypothetical protein
VKVAPLLLPVPLKKVPPTLLPAPLVVPPPAMPPLEPKPKGDFSSSLDTQPLSTAHAPQANTQSAAAVVSLERRVARAEAAGVMRRGSASDVPLLRT